MKQQCRNWLAAGLALCLLAGCERQDVSTDWGSDQYGRPVAAAELKGRWLVLNYWALWCGPCRKEVPELNRFARELGEAPVVLLGVNFDGLQGPELRQDSESLGIDYPVLVTDPRERLGEPAPTGLPFTLIVDPHGRVRARLAGEQTAASLRAQLQQLGALR